MKRRAIKISPVVLVLAGVSLGLLVALTWEREPEISFAFLNGRTLTAPVEQDPGGLSYRTTREVYSFEADFNDVCARADAELSVMGFEIDTFGPWRGSTPGFYPDREYKLGDYASGERSIVLRIHKNIEMTHAPEGRLRPRPAKGWVSVEVWRRRSRSWPPKYFLIRLRLMWHRCTKRRPAQSKNAPSIK